MKKLFLLLVISSISICLVSGCSYKKEPIQVVVPPLENKGADTTKEEESDLSKDIVVEDIGWERTVKNIKHNFELSFPSDFQIKRDTAKADLFSVEDFNVYVATGTVEGFNDDFWKRNDSTGIDNLKIKKIKTSGGLGYVQYYEGEDAVKSYRFLAPLKEKGKVLFVDFFYQGAFDYSGFFDSVVSTVKVY